MPGKQNKHTLLFRKSYISTKKRKVTFQDIKSTDQYNLVDHP